ncbi:MULTISPECIES: hypothetical protein [unclassified Coleofasciculus]|uniref:hypothetical protein n=1 Tax=unclassified Coleofasciculus TaxID=2692782 RepID=UPI002AD3BB71|nr:MULTISPECIES: hypothetical protein [unclassified Coleofasciculus]
MSVTSVETPSTCPQVDPFTKAVDKATGAANLAQSARSPQEWDLVVLGWIQAIEAMQAVSPDSPKRAFAQKKVAEYLRNVDIAQQKASTVNSPLPFASFNNPIFEEQLLLYLSYVAAVGPPDVLIVGSSRALVGVDPQQLQQALAQNGKGGFKIFNLGVNGATAQFVDFQLRQLLTPEQLPRLIIWADGVRAFNSGRVDKTYNSLTASVGYQSLNAGDRPKLAETKPDTIDACENIPVSISSSPKKEPSVDSGNATSPTGTSERWRLARVSFETTSNPESNPTKRLLLTQLRGTQEPQRLTLVRNTTGYSTVAIDANGFLPMDGKFEPKTYYQQHPRVAGRYDADYQPFSFSGSQATALNSVKAFAKQQQIPLVIVNLPLSRDYLDSVRLSREGQFRQIMQQHAASDGLVFIDLGRQWVDQNQYFADPSHLNRYGAAGVSSVLATKSEIPWPQARP